jgi:hypothetical protein
LAAGAAFVALLSVGLSAGVAQAAGSTTAGGSTTPAASTPTTSTTSTTVASSAAATPVTTAMATPTLPGETALLRITFSTTSDWAQLQLGPGTISGLDVVSSTGSPQLTSIGGGWSLKPTAGPASVVLETVLTDASDSQFAALVLKGYLGTVSVTIQRITPSGAVASVASFVDSVHSTTDPDNRMLEALSRSTLIGTGAALPQADPRRLVLAFYYPWFGAAQYASPTLADMPVDPRSVWSAPGVTSMVQQAHSSGIDGFIVSWAGSTNGPAMNLVEQAADANGFLVAPYLETASATVNGSVSASEVEQWLDLAVTTMSGHSSTLTSGGEPVIFVYEMDLLPASTWAGMLGRLAAAGHPVRLVGDANLSYSSVSWGFDRYTPSGGLGSLIAWGDEMSSWLRSQPMVSGSTPPLLATTVSPGYDDQNLRGPTNPIVPRGTDGSQYATTWQGAVAAAPDWILVTSWNEWYEGTEVEPGVANGSLALSQTAAWSAAWKAAAS